MPNSGVQSRARKTKKSSPPRLPILKISTAPALAVTLAVVGVVAEVEDGAGRLADPLYEVVTTRSTGTDRSRLNPRSPLLLNHPMI